jgi:hypothetical protein
VELEIRPQRHLNYEFLKNRSGRGGLLDYLRTERLFALGLLQSIPPISRWEIDSRGKRLMPTSGLDTTALPPVSHPVSELLGERGKLQGE